MATTSWLQRVPKFSRGRNVLLSAPTIFSRSETRERRPPAFDPDSRSRSSVMRFKSPAFRLRASSRKNNNPLSISGELERRHDEGETNMNSNASVAAALATDQPLTSDELEQAHLYLRQSKAGLHGATKRLSDTQWKFNPAPERWS